MPTNKDAGIENALTSLIGISRQQAAAEEICTWCKQPLGQFRDRLSIMEHGISGMCQTCQDNIFDSEE